MFDKDAHMFEPYESDDNGFQKCYPSYKESLGRKGDQSHRREINESLLLFFPYWSMQVLVGVSISSVNRILKHEGLHPWKFTPAQQIKETDFEHHFYSEILQQKEERRKG